MIAPGFKAALVTYAESLGTVGLQALVDEHAELYAKVIAGDGTQLVNSTINGKGFGFQVNMTIEEKFSVFGEAIREISGDTVQRTIADFRCLER
jgi:hypothetical protein